MKLKRSMNHACMHICYIWALAMVGIRYHRGPSGGAISIAINPLMQTVAMPSPVLRMYWKSGKYVKNEANNSTNRSNKNIHVSSTWKKIYLWYQSLTCSGVRTKDLFPMVNAMSGMFEMLSHSITDSPDGLGRLSQSCERSKPILNIAYKFIAGLAFYWCLWF